MGKPLLLFANKQDLVHAVPAEQVVQMLELHRSARASSHQACPCSAKTGEGLDEGVRWLSEQLGAGRNAGRIKAR